MQAAIWLRVSTSGQEAANQLPEVEQFAAHHGYQIVKRYEVSDSAWNGGKAGGEYQRALKQALDDAWAGKFSVLIVWAVDRMTRGGAEDALRLVRLFRERGCTVVSVSESWLSTAPDVLLAFAGWVAQQESKRRSERVRAGIEARRMKGTWRGRGKDQAKRRRTGYRGNVNAAKRTGPAAS